MKAISIIFLLAVVSSCNRGDLSDKVRAPATPPSVPAPAPEITNSVLEAELSEPMQTPTGRRDHRILFAKGEGLQSPHHRAIVWGGLRETTSGPNYVSWGALFNPRIKRWTAFDEAAAPGAPVPRAGHSLVWTGDRVIVWGGDRGPLRLPSGSAYNFTLKKWSPLSQPESLAPRSGHATIWLNEKMYVLGGCTSCPFAMTYSPADDTWKDLIEPTLEIPRYFGMALTIRKTDGSTGILYVANAGSPAAQREVLLLDTQSNRWQNINLPELSNSEIVLGTDEPGRTFFLTRSLSGQGAVLKLYRFDEDKTSLNRIELPPVTAAWSTLQSLTIVDGSLIVLGGEPKMPMAVAYAKIKQSGELEPWIVFDSPDAPWPRPGTSAVPLENNQFLFWGGETAGPDRYEAKSLVFDLIHKTWTTIAP